MKLHVLVAAAAILSFLGVLAFADNETPMRARLLKALAVAVILGGVAVFLVPILFKMGLPRGFDIRF
jgi:hypothetical protein